MESLVFECQAMAAQTMESQAMMAQVLVFRPWSRNQAFKMLWDLSQLSICVLDCDDKLKPVIGTSFGSLEEVEELYKIYALENFIGCNIPEHIEIHPPSDVHSQ